MEKQATLTMFMMAEAKHQVFSLSHCKNKMSLFLFNLCSKKLFL